MVSAALWLINWTVHLLVFRGSWTVFAAAVHSKEGVKDRHRTRKAAAEAARRLVESIPEDGLPRASRSPRDDRARSGSSPVTVPGCSLLLLWRKPRETAENDHLIAMKPCLLTGVADRHDRRTATSIRVMDRHSAPPTCR
jgi:hypothetical protein